MELDPKLAPKVSFIWPGKQGKSINKKGNLKKKFLLSYLIYNKR